MEEIPIITQQARTALWIALVLSILDFGLMLGNIGLSSFFLGLCATCMSLIHLPTHLIVIRVREKRAVRRNGTTHSGNNLDGNVIPPTSTLPSIFVTVFITVFYVAAFPVSIFGLVSHQIYNLSPVVVIIDAVFELFCAAALVWLVVVGARERKGYFELTSRVRLEDAPAATN